MKKINVILWGSIISFLAAGLIATKVVQLTESIESLLQALAVSILVIIIVTRFIIPKFQEKNPSLAYFIQFAPLSLFVYLLVFATGGLASPFLILTHLFAIGMAFLISPGVSMAYVAITAFYIIVNISSDPTARQLISDSPFAVFLYILAYGAILPFSQYIAKIYKQKDAWVSELSQMLVTSKKEEERLLKNIENAVVVISRDLEVSFINKAVSEKFGFSEIDLLTKKVFDILKFRDNGGNNLEGEKLPIAAVISTKNEAKIDRLQLLDKSGKYIRINLKILPVIEHTGEVPGAMLILSEYSEKESLQEGYFESVEKKLNKISSEKIATLAQDLLLMLKLESEAVQGLSEFINISTLVENRMFEFMPFANAKNINLTCPSPTSTTTLPISGKVLAPQKKCSFAAAFILANQMLLAEAIDHLLKFAIYLSQKDTVLKVDIKIELATTKIVFQVKTNTAAAENIPTLFMKFANEKLNLAELKDSTGLEIPIAQNIFEKHGGNLKIEKSAGGLTFIASLIRPETLIPPQAKTK